MASRWALPHISGSFRFLLLIFIFCSLFCVSCNLFDSATLLLFVYVVMFILILHFYTLRLCGAKVYFVGRAINDFRRLRTRKINENRFGGDLDRQKLCGAKVYF